MVVPSDLTIALEGTASSIGVFRIGFEAEDIAGSEGAGGSEGASTSAGRIEESGVSINAHLEEVLEGND